jgi:hypothetical protein
MPSPTAAEPISLTVPMSMSLSRDNPIGELFDRRIQQLYGEQNNDDANEQQAFPGLHRKEESGRNGNDEHDELLPECLVRPHGRAESAAAVNNGTKQPVHGVAFHHP